MVLTADIAEESTVTATPPGAPDVGDTTIERRDILAGRLFQAALGGFEMLTVYAGDRLGWYRALAEHGPTTSADLAARTGTHERYTREWLEQQAVTGILDVDDPSAEPAARRYSLPPGHDEVLVDRLSLAYLPPLIRFLHVIPQALPQLLQAYRTGGGVAWGQFGPEASEAHADLNRPAFTRLLPTEWLPAIPDVHARLQAPLRGPDSTPARVADIACGGGWSSIAIAQAYPNALVDGFDLDAPGIAIAHANAVAAGVADRVTFHVRDATDPRFGDEAGHYDLVTVFEALHDVARPVALLENVRKLAAGGGTVFIVDERVAETFTAPGDDVERFMYASSVLFCLPCGMADQPSAGTGTVMRPATLRRYAAEAGFRDVEILPIEHDFFRFYRLHA